MIEIGCFFFFFFKYGICSQFCEVKDKVRYNNSHKEITWASVIYCTHTHTIIWMEISKLCNIFCCLNINYELKLRKKAPK